MTVELIQPGYHQFYRLTWRGKEICLKRKNNKGIFTGKLEPMVSKDSLPNVVQTWNEFEQHMRALTA